MTYNRKDLSVKVDIKSIKGYTMREIGALDERLKKIEYYTVLNALELDAKTLSIKDDTGNLERFKNGIFADPFNDFSIANKNDREFRLAIDSQNSLARPLYDELFHNFKLSTAASSNIKIAGKIAMIDYDNEYFGGNKYANNYRNCTEAYYSYIGRMQLFPSFDNKNEVNTGTSQAASQTVTVDIANAFEKFNGVIGIGKDIKTVTGTTNIIGGDATRIDYRRTDVTTVKDLLVDIVPVNYDLGPFIKDMSQLEWMRSRIISVVVRGLKPSTRMYMFFDKVDVTMHCAPAYVSDAYAASGSTDKSLRRIDPTKVTELVVGKENEILTQNGNIGDPIYSNNVGDAYFIFLIPPKTFRSGDRTLIVTNADDLKALFAQLTRAEGTYTASALAVTTQNLSFSILQPEFRPRTIDTPTDIDWSVPTVDPGDPGGGVVDPTPPPIIPEAPPPAVGATCGGCGGGGAGDDPTAETFVISQTNTTMNNNVGIYLTQIGVFFKNKSPNIAISCCVVGTTVGIPDRDKILGRAYLNPSDISVSDDASAETIFTFATPILLQSDLTYAFWIEPDGCNPGYEIWYSEVGNPNPDKTTNQDITQQPYHGIMYVSSNGKSWSAVQSSDIKFKMYRAKFKYTDATAVFRNETDEFITLSALERQNTGTSISVGDVVYAANTANTLQTFTNTAQYPFGIVEAVDELNNILTIEKSNGFFSNTTYPNLKIYRVAEVGNVEQIVIENLIANCTISTINNLEYHGIVPKFNVVEPLGTKITMNFFGTANGSFGFAKDTNNFNVKNEAYNIYQDYERVLRSYSNETAGSYGEEGNATFKIRMQTSNDYFSPVIDLNAKTFNFIKNIVNTDSSNEHTRYGNSLNKYISKRVSLAQEAEDLLVYVTGYRPVGTDIIVYGKFLNRNDNENFDSKAWTELTLKRELQSSYGSPQNTDDYREYVYEMPVGRLPSTDERYALNAYLDPDSVDPTKVLTYEDSLGEIYTGYNIFAIKIVILSDNPVILPTMRDVRAIALQR